MYAAYATRSTRLDSSSSLADRTINDGEPVWIHQIVVASTANETVTFTDADANSPADVLTVVVGANSTEDVEPYYPYDEGFIVPALTTAVVTVFWRPTG